MQRLWAGGELKEAHGKAEANVAGQESAGRQQTCAGGSREWEDYQAWQVHGRAFGFSPKDAASTGRFGERGSGTGPQVED